MKGKKGISKKYLALMAAAVAVGIVSGLAATGVDQAWKQLEQ